LNMAVGDTTIAGNALINLGWLAYALEDYAEARVAFFQAIEAYRVIKDRFYIAEALDGLASTYRTPSSIQAAIQLLAAAEMLRETAGVAIPSLDRARYEQIVGDIKKQASAKQFVAAWDEGRRMSIEHIYAFIDTLQGRFKG
ncbi:MAG TPA: hypothetical protein VD886_10810, partial [Herpetosiphonaceae bacterium]|nr:hypothetical protein [Herpetosiphonaceae bacterium]